MEISIFSTQEFNIHTKIKFLVSAYQLQKNYLLRKNKMYYGYVSLSPEYLSIDNSAFYFPFNSTVLRFASLASAEFLMNIKLSEKFKQIDFP